MSNATTVLSRIIDLSLPERRAAILRHVAPDSSLRLPPHRAPPVATARALLKLAADLRVEGPEHTARTAAWTRVVARALGVRGRALRACTLGAWLHDVGKLAVPDAVIHRPGLYDDADWAALRAHSDAGARMLDGIPGLEDAARLVATHHEHADGSGYPRGLRGDAIPLGSRIFTVCDSYDAMTRTGAEREWGDPVTHDAAIADLRRQAGDRYDAACVEAFVRSAGTPRATR